MKVLILAYDFPPYTSMGGQRPYGWHTYLHESGISSTVVTRHWHAQTQSKIDYCRACGHETTTEQTAGGAIVRVPYCENMRDRLLVKYGMNRFVLLRQLLSLWYSVAQFLCSAFDNKSGIYFQADILLRQEKFDYIIATGEPFILFRYAFKLAQKHKLPWIPDYRDCWSDNYEVNQNGGFSKWLYKYVFRSLEKKYVNSSLAITTAAPVFKAELTKLFPHKDITVIYNGYVGTSKTLVKDNQISNKQLTIGFAGTIYTFQPIEIYLAGLALFIAEQPQAKIKTVFWGADYSAEQRARICQFDSALAPYIETTARLDQATLFEQMVASDMFLILDNKGMISGKLYEYLMFDKKIIMAGRDFGSMEEILTNTNAGIICATPVDVAESLRTTYAEWINTGKVTSSLVNVEQYSRNEQTTKLANMLYNLQKVTSKKTSLSVQ